MLYYITNFIGIVFEIYTITSYFSKISTVRVSKRSFKLFIVLFVILQFLNNCIFLSKSYIIMIVAFLLTFLISQLYDFKALTRIFSTCFICLMSFLSESITAMLITAFAGVTLEEVQANIFLFAMGTFISKFIALTIIKALKFKNKKNTNWLPKSLAVSTLPLPFVTIFILILIYRCCYEINDLKFRILVLISSVLLIGANIFIFLLIDKENEHIKTKERLKFAQAQVSKQIEHYAELYKYQNELRSFRHDTKNRQLSLIGLIKNKEYDKAIEILQKDVDFLNDKNKTIVFSSNPVVDAIIQSKIIFAETRKIEIKTYFKLSVPIRIDEYELGVLIGNALDNAIEATEKVKLEARKPIYINLITSEDNLLISIKNPVEKDIDTRNLKSTKADKHNHGYGLNSIRSIVEKHNGVLKLSCENYEFEINISITNTVT